MAGELDYGQYTFSLATIFLRQIGQLMIFSFAMHGPHMHRWKHGEHSHSTVRSRQITQMGSGILEFMCIPCQLSHGQPAITMGADAYDKMSLREPFEYGSVRWVDPVKAAAASAAQAPHLHDPWLSNIWWCIRRLGSLVILFIMLGMILDFGMAFYDTFNAEQYAKFEAKGHYDMYCKPQQYTTMSAQILGECTKLKAVLERNTALHAYHGAADHCAEHIPGLAYCRKHPDMCALVTIRALDVLAYVFYWFPVLFGCSVLWYLWPTLLGACLNRLAKSTPVPMDQQQPLPRTPRPSTPRWKAD